MEWVVCLINYIHHERNESEECIMQAIILAAGMGKRLKELTRDNTNAWSK